MIYSEDGSPVCSNIENTTLQSATHIKRLDIVPSQGPLWTGGFVRPGLSTFSDKIPRSNRSLAKGLVLHMSTEEEMKI